MPFVPPVIVDGHAYCREHSRPAYTPHEFSILVGFSCEIRNQFFEHEHAGKLPKNQEGFPAVQTVRQNGRFVEPLIDVTIALAAPVVRTMHRFRPQGYPCPTTFAPVSTVGRCLVWTSMPLCGIVGCRGVRHGPREGWWSAHLLRQGAQSLPGLSPLPRGGARVRHPAGKDPQRS